MQPEQSHVVPIGMLRSIKLIGQKEAEAAQQEFSYLGQLPEIKIMFGSTGYEVIAVLDELTPLLAFPGEPGNGIFVFASGSDHVQKVACSYAHLQQIIVVLESAWKGKEEEAFLERTEENKKVRDEAMNALEHPCDFEAEFWRYYAFRELDITMY